MSDDDKAFMRQYAAEIAKALREQDERRPSSGHSSSSTSVDDSTRALYRALCFDEPLLDDIPNLTMAASALCRHLTNSSSDYGLSNRLVNGIIYLCRQRGSMTKTPSTNTTAPTTPAASTTTTTTSTNDGETLITSIAIAKLAFCVLIQLPLECCQSLLLKNDDLSTVQRLLGSYRGSVELLRKRNTPLEKDEVGSISDETDQRVTQLAQVLSKIDIEKEEEEENIVHDTSPRIPSNMEEQESSSLQEVWAVDSDPSDYDYDDGDDRDGGGGGESTSIVPSQFQQEMDSDDFLDPILLSRPDLERTVKDARDAIGSLLQQASYSIMAAIFQLSKKQVETYTSQLTQLLLIILQPPKSILSQGDDDDSSSSSSSMQDVMLTPLWILRDAALHHPSHENSHYVVVYLETIQTLLAVDQAYQSDTPCGQQSSLPPLCVASIVGLSALSSWCCSAQLPLSVTTNAILDAMNDLTYVMERATKTGYRENLQHSIPPIVEVLTGITFDDRKNGDGGGTAGGTMMIPQTLLNSGFLRQMLTISIHNGSSDDDDHVPPPYFLDHALWGLCVSYPAVVGKYVVRYPGFSSIVRRYNNRQKKESSRDYVQSILWNTFALAHSFDSSTPQMVWKTKGGNAGASSPPLSLTKDECQEISQKSWTRLCRMVQESISLDSDPSTSAKQSLIVVQDWERLLKLITVPTLGSTFQGLITEHDIQLSSILGDVVRAAAAAASTGSTGEGSDRRNTNEKLDDDDDEEDRKKSSLSHQELIIATIRKVHKQYTLFFQGNTRSSSKTD